MGSLAVLAKQLGHQVSGSDRNVYPPMSTQLQQQGIELKQGYQAAHLQPEPDLVVIGNALSRGNEAVETVLEKGLDYCSGPQWLAQHVLQDKWVLAVAGTHGKTSTSSMLAWILDYAGLNPGYLIGGLPTNFQVSARLGDSSFFVVEADEYDCAFFDKRSKFVHYKPRTLILNNLEYDHADIFPDLAAIQRQVHHLVRTIPANGLIICPYGDANIQQTLAQGLWSELQTIKSVDSPAELVQTPASAPSWQVHCSVADGSSFEISLGEISLGEISLGNKRANVEWALSGAHNVQNGAAAMVAAYHVGVSLSLSSEALKQFSGVKRRMELIGEINGIKVYDDFAHHPTAIASSLRGMREKLSVSAAKGRIIAVIEPRSNTMKAGVHQSALGSACDSADLVLWYQAGSWELDLQQVAADSVASSRVFGSIDQIIEFLLHYCKADDQIVIMSNGKFEGLHDRLLESLAAV